MKKTLPGYYYNSDTKRYYKLLAGHCHDESSRVLTKEMIAFSLACSDLTVPTKAVKQRLNSALVGCQLYGTRLKKSLQEEFCVSRISHNMLHVLPSWFSWSTVENMLFPHQKLEPIIISQNNAEIIVRFAKIEQNEIFNSETLEMKLNHLRLSETYPCARYIGELIDPVIASNPSRLIFAQSYGFGQSSIVLHDIEHGYDECLSFGSREIWSCSYGHTFSRIGVGSRQCSYCIDPETRAVQTCSTDSQDVLALSFGTANSSVQYVMFNGCRNGSVVATDLRVPDKVLTLIAKGKSHEASISSVLPLPMDEHLIIISDRSGKVVLWDLRNSTEPLGIFSKKNALVMGNAKYNISDDGSFLYAICSDDILRIWSSTSCEMLSSYSLGGEGNDLLLIMNQHLNVDPLSLISTHRISYINGLIKRLKVHQLRHWLQLHGQDWKGHKDVIAKRLKALVRREAERFHNPDIAKAPKPERAASQCRYFFVMDIEATCEEPLPQDFPHEIIELPVIVVDATTREIVDEFRELCRPIGNPVLTDFCITLTGITQTEVDAADTFAGVFPRLLQFLAPYLEYPSMLVTDSPYDVYRFLLPACLQHCQTFPDWGRSWMNIRKSFSYFYKVERMNLAGMLSHLGLEFEGRPHCGVDDAKNIARILITLLNDGCVPNQNEGLSKTARSLSCRNPNCPNDIEVANQGPSSGAVGTSMSLPPKEQLRKIDLAMLNLAI